MRYSGFSLLLLVVYVLLSPSVYAASVTDDAGQTLHFAEAPRRVVSLVPAASEIIAALGSASALVGTTCHDAPSPKLAGKTLVGGAFTPHFEIINALEPDLLIAAPRDLAAAKAGRGTNTYPILVYDDGASLAVSEQRIEMLGRIFRKSAQVPTILRANHDLLDVVARKVQKISPEKRLKVMRVYLSDQGLFTCGDDSFQTELIRAAGGLTGKFGQGFLVPVDLEQWKAFAPDLVFTCGAEQEDLKAFLRQEGWREVPAAQREIAVFPCALTCQAATHTGYFAAWLASLLYTDFFADTNNLVFPQTILGERTLNLDIPYVDTVRIVESRLMDFTHRTLLIDFKTPQTVVSTIGSLRRDIHSVGNSFSPVPTWSLYHKLGFDRSRDILFQGLKLDPKQVELLTTGADMNNLVIKTARFDDLHATALVTAGVEGNAVRTGKDVGAWHEPGTINIIVLTNRRLTERAATRAIITATEAKTAALWDMDIRSVQSGLLNPATGTGTDEIIVVCGEGNTVTNAGQHAKMGELIAAAVYPAVQEALLKQNAKLPRRHLMQRLAERGITTHNLWKGASLPIGKDRPTFEKEFEALLLSPVHRGFVEAALSLSDADVAGRLSDRAAFERWCLQAATAVAGQPVSEIETVLARTDLPPVLASAFNALATGLGRRQSGVR